MSPNAVGLAILPIQQEDIITRPLEERGLFPYMCISFKVGKYFWRFPNSYQAFVKTYWPELQDVPIAP